MITNPKKYFNMNTKRKYELFDKIIGNGYWQEIPGREKRVEEFVNSAFSFLFPSCNECILKEEELEQRFLGFKNLFTRFYCPVGDKTCNIEREFEGKFFDQIPIIYELLLSDAKSLYDGDPAAKTLAEVIHLYPGFYATFIYRIAHSFYNLGKPVLARMLSEFAHSQTGVDIHPGAKIGKSFSIDHGTGIVIGETSIIGNNVKIYQGVTLGAKNVEKCLANNKRHPTIKDDVTIYSGASILGGDTIVGKGSTIGGNVFLLHSVPENSIVYQKHEVKVKEKIRVEGLLS